MIATVQHYLRRARSDRRARIVERGRRASVDLNRRQRCGQRRTHDNARGWLHITPYGQHERIGTLAPQSEIELSEVRG